MFKHALALGLASLALLLSTGGTSAEARSVTWTKTVLHLDWKTAKTVVSRDKYTYVIHSHRPVLGYRNTTTKVSPHVKIKVHYPVFAAKCEVNPGLGSEVTRWLSAICPAAAQTGLSPRVIAADISVESGGDPGVVSGGGAVGLMQLLPSTAASIGYGGNLFDPYTNVEAGAHYITYLMRTYSGGDLRTALAMYNGGPANPQFGYADLVLSRQ